MTDSLKQALAQVEGLAAPSRQQVVDAMVEQGIALTGSSIGYFAVMNETEDELTMLGWSRSAMGACAMMDKPIVYPLEQTGIWGDCVRERAAVVTNDYEGCTRLTKKGYPDGHVAVVRHMNVPMRAGAQIVGILGVGNKDADYSQADADALQSFADECWPCLKDAQA